MKTPNDITAQLVREFRRALQRVLDNAERELASLVRRVRTCEGCGAHFVDRSKNQTRRWCDMRRCGNVAKVRRHRAVT